MADEIPPDAAAAMIRARAAIDPGYIARLIQVESGGDPNARTGSYRGLTQLGPREEAAHGINDSNRTDVGAQTRAATAIAERNASALRRALGREPTNGELYLAHQQGIAGAPALLTAPADTPAWRAIRPFYRSDDIARQAIVGNLPTSMRGNPDISAQAFREHWVNHFERPGAPRAAVPPGVVGAPGSQAASVPAGATAGPSQTGAVPVDPSQAAGSEDELLRTLQVLSAPAQQETMPAPPPLRLQMAQPAAKLQKARALAAAMGRRMI